jgi:hypothetical protein
MVTGLLTVAFLFFVFARASVMRSEAQSAADAAALAAAQEASEHLLDNFIGAVGGDGEPGDILDGSDFELDVESDCEEARRLAEANESRLALCDPIDGRVGYTVSVETLDTVGDSLIPGTENDKAHAEATAVIRGLCELTSEEEDQVELDCEDSDDISFDPGEDDERPDARDLFLVYLDD